MEMDEEMEVEADVEAQPVVFEAYEVDVEYEFDASMYFDFTRAESRAEARLTELWFESAKSYSPSPFVANLFLRESTLLETINSSQESGKTGEPHGEDNNLNIGPVFSVVDANNRGCERPVISLIYGMRMYRNMRQSHKRISSTIARKPFVPRSSTLMKPTASQLAKQNLFSHFSRSRFQKLPLDNEVKGFCNSAGVESHATKKQKLDGGFSRKVIEEQPTNFFHKVSRKDVPVDKTAIISKLKLTIPREPDLVTAHRAQRIRSKISSTELVQETMETRQFKARPLNRKILEAPSIPLAKKSTPKLPEFHEFHLKTSERATQNSSAVLSNSSHCSDLDKVPDKRGTFHASKNSNKERERSNTVGSPKKDGHSMMQNFKAHLLNRKIFLSKGDIGIFRNTKREATVPMEFNLHTQKRIHLPPTDLFSKLSLKSNLPPDNGLKMKLPQPTSLFKKDSKENRSVCLQIEHEMMPVVKQKPPLVENRLNLVR